MGHFVTRYTIHLSRRTLGMSDKNLGLIIYHGNCHCGHYRFELAVPEIKGGLCCSCTVCKKKGYLWLDAVEGLSTLNVTRDDGDMVEYSNGTVKDKFCGACGTGITSEHVYGSLKGRLLINIRAIREVNPVLIERRTVETSSSNILIEPAADCHEVVTGPLLPHNFTCACGKVRAELIVPIEDFEVKEDNCSSCVRNAWIGIYPSRSQVSLLQPNPAAEKGASEDAVFDYFPNPTAKYTATNHCKICGVCVYKTVYGPPLSIFDRIEPPERREKALAVYRKNVDMVPLNMRALYVEDGVAAEELKMLRVERMDEGTGGYSLPGE